MITAADEGEAGADGSHPGRVLAIRDRTESDLDECVRLLAEVHRHDGYPMRWPADPRRFLGTSKIIAAWVATVDGQLAGHVGLSVVCPGDAAPQLLGITTSEADPADLAGHGGTAGREATHATPSVGGAAGAGPVVGGAAGAGPAVGGAAGLAGSGRAGAGTAASGATGAGPAGSGGVVMISRLFVTTAARGCGAGRALMLRAVQGAHERGQYPLLDVHTANTSAIALYERLGWNFLGTTDTQWGSDQVTVRSYTAPARTPH